MDSKKEFIPKELASTYELDDGRIIHTTNHSDCRMKQRRISIEDVIETFKNPTFIVPNVEYSNAQNYMRRDSNGIFKIGIKDATEPIVIITVFYIKNE